MIIEIKNCNNIDNCKIRIEENRLNIKYANNGIGKSTISKAISSSVNDRLEGTSKLNELTPFKAVRDNEIKPFVDGTIDIDRVMVFDEAYVDGFIYHPDELIKGSFDGLPPKKESSCNVRLELKIEGVKHGQEIAFSRADHQQVTRS